MLVNVWCGDAIAGHGSALVNVAELVVTAAFTFAAVIDITVAAFVHDRHCSHAIRLFMLQLLQPQVFPELLQVHLLVAVVK